MQRFRALQAKSAERIEDGAKPLGKLTAAHHLVEQWIDDAVEQLQSMRYTCALDIADESAAEPGGRGARGRRRRAPRRRAGHAGGADREPRPGTAYRVVATTRSSIEALHGRRLSFGAIKPGADKVRKLQVTPLRGRQAAVLPQRNRRLAAGDALPTLRPKGAVLLFPFRVRRPLRVEPGAQDMSDLLAAHCAVHGERAVANTRSAV